MVVQLNVALFFGINLDFLFHENLVIGAKHPWHFILIKQIVHIFEHKASFELIICEQKDALLEVTASIVQTLFNIFLPLILIVVLRLFRLHDFLMHQIRG